MVSFFETWQKFNIRCLFYYIFHFILSCPRTCLYLPPPHMFFFMFSLSLILLPSFLALFLLHLPLSRLHLHRLNPFQFRCFITERSSQVVVQQFWVRIPGYSQPNINYHFSGGLSLRTASWSVWKGLWKTVTWKARCVLKKCKQKLLLDVCKFACPVLCCGSKCTCFTAFLVHLLLFRLFSGGQSGSTTMFLKKTIGKLDNATYIVLT